MLFRYVLQHNGMPPPYLFSMVTHMQLHRAFGSLASSILITSTLLTTATQAGVVVNGTRIIYENGQTEKAIQLDNRDNFPNLVQLWTDRGNEDLTIETADGPFMTNPQIFKMSPNQSQIVRMHFTGNTQELPQDKESLFFLNVNEIPALKAKDLAANRLVVSFTNRIKVFYRPKGVEGTSADTPKNIRYEIQGNHIRLHNPTPYYANISQIQLLQNNKALKTDKSLVIAPKAFLDWKATPTSSGNVQIKAIFINDFGAAVNTDLTAQ